MLFMLLLLFMLFIDIVAVPVVIVVVTVLVSIAPPDLFASMATGTGCVVEPSATRACHVPLHLLECHVTKQFY